MFVRQCHSKQDFKFSMPLCYQSNYFDLHVIRNSPEHNSQKATVPR